MDIIAKIYLIIIYLAQFKNTSTAIMNKKKAVKKFFQNIVIKSIIK